MPSSRLHRGARSRPSLPSLLAFAAALAACACAGDAGPAAEPVNVLLISIDTLRPDRLGCYGHDRETSPTIDAVAAGGVLFEDVTSAAPWTLPAHTSMLTGLYPRSHGVRGHNDKLAATTRSLATRLHDVGYSTMAVINSHNLSKRYGLNQGFDRFLYLLEEDEDNVIVDRGPQIVDLGLDFLRNRDDRPFFLFLHFYDVHSDFNPSPEYRQRFERPYSGDIDGTTAQLGELRASGGLLTEADANHLLDLYDAEIRQLDDQLARLFNYLDHAGLAANTLVVVTSDHGEAFGEHGTVLHGQTHYEELIRIPLLMRGPGMLVGRRIADPVHLVDVTPTILASTGLPDATLDGIDLHALWSGAPVPDRFLFSEADHNNSKDDVRRMIRFEGHKLHYDKRDGATAMYDIATDPGELRDVSKEEPELADLLMARLQTFMSSEVEAEANSELSPEDQRLLESLGYVDGDQ